MLCKFFGDHIVEGIDCQLTGIWIHLIFFQHVLDFCHDDSDGKDRTGVRLYNDRVPGHQASINPGNGIPRRKGGTTNHNGNPFGCGSPFFVKLNIELSHRFVPQGF